MPSILLSAILSIPSPMKLQLLARKKLAATLETRESEERHTFDRYLTVWGTNELLLVTKIFVASDKSRAVCAGHN